MDVRYEFGSLYAVALRQKVARARLLNPGTNGEAALWIHIDDIQAEAFADTFDAMQAEIDALRAELAALRANVETVAGVDLPETKEGA